MISSHLTLPAVPALRGVVHRVADGIDMDSLHFHTCSSFLMLPCSFVHPKKILLV
uniref:Uncharacterized protein n=1 Tax=Arundo donax TaxID=35708 RepID=A0A0A8XV81_ARUDO